MCPLFSNVCRLNSGLLEGDCGSAGREEKQGYSRGITSLSLHTKRLSQ